MLTVDQVAQKLAVSVKVVYGLCQRRRIRYSRIGEGRGIIRISEEAVQEYIRSVTVDPTADSQEIKITARPAVILKHLKPREHDGRGKVG